MVQVRPKRPQPLSKWIEATLRLPVGLSAEPGPIKLAPYMRAIADAITDPKIERITLQKSARVGWTTLMSGAVGHFMVRDPCRVLVVWPTESDARGWIVNDLEPTFADSPALADALPVPRPGKLTHTTILNRISDNGSVLTAVGAGAPRNLRRHSARVLIVDEADACEVLTEGNPLALAVMRTLSFPNRKILIGSTPLNAESSHVARLYAESDQRVWEVPCPACGAFAEIKWSDIEWPDGRPELAAWRCPNCKALVPEKHKPQMVRRGRWRALRPGAGTSHAGFRINALVSGFANAGWGRLAAEYLKARDDDDTLRVFTNTVLGEVWAEASDQIDESALAGRVESFDLDHIPADVLAVTVGVDCQDDRIESTILGHARNGDALVLAHVTLWGSPLDDDCWQEVDAMLRQRWRHPLGGHLKVDAAVIDAGGHFDAVMAFCGPRLGRKILPGKGAAGFARPAIQMSKSKHGGRLFIIGVDGLKSAIFARLARGRSIRFSHVLDASYFEQLSSERRVVRMARGRPVVRFERIPGKRAESLDAMVYALAARAALALSAAAFDQRTDALRSPDTPPPRSPPTIRSAWMDR